MPQSLLILWGISFVPIEVEINGFTLCHYKEKNCRQTLNFFEFVYSSAMAVPNVGLVLDRDRPSPSRQYESYPL